MTYTDMQNKKIHQGRNIKRFREMLGIKQEALALELGDDWNQKKISLLEQKETVETDILTQVAKILKVPAEAIENFDEESAINIIANTFHDSAVANTFTEGAQANFHCTFNPLDKMVELYERMLEQQKEMIEKLERLIEKE
ncbi:Helix-turn-helix domain protein [Chryseobacterium oranimense G311]|uniref:helix-turn-helix transcriptional regulator n=1 Tax=Chryseobacterium oranimense TaxID=421058 RepID=UPI000533A204|nr:helix-turn-helix transcriptional regulator [Chryseobacterium oranimense]CEJ69285.1 Helix-turn-helix domain protein [Chryseobacterium oranimense G311]